MKNLLGIILQLCCTAPAADYRCDGYCQYISHDIAQHTVYARVTSVLDYITIDTLTDYAV